MAPMIDVTLGGPAYDLDEGIYPAHIIKTVADELANATYASGKDILRIYIRLDDMVTPEEEPVEIDAIATRKLAPSTKLWKWVTQLGINLDPETANKWNSDELNGMACRVVIGSKKKVDGSVWPTVENVLAPAKSGNTVAPKAPVSNGPVAGPAPQPLRDLRFFWKQVDRLGITHEQALARTTRPLEDYDEDQQLDLIELLRMEYTPAPAQ